MPNLNVGVFIHWQNRGEHISHNPGFCPSVTAKALDRKWFCCFLWIYVTRL